MFPSNWVLQIAETLRRAARAPCPSLGEILAVFGLAGAIVAPIIVCLWLITTNGDGELPMTRDVGTFLGALLSAQAAVAALTLAVTRFCHARCSLSNRR